MLSPSNEQIISIAYLLDGLLSANYSQPEKGICLRTPNTQKSHQTAYTKILNNLCRILEIDDNAYAQDRQENPNSYQLLKKYLIRLYAIAQTEKKENESAFKKDLLNTVKNPEQFQQIIDTLQCYFLFGILEPLNGLPIINGKIDQIIKQLYINLASFLNSKNSDTELQILVSTILDLEREVNIATQNPFYTNICKNILNNLLTLIGKSEEYQLNLGDVNHLKATLYLTMNARFAEFVKSKISILSQPENKKWFTDAKMQPQNQDVSYKNTHEIYQKKDESSGSFMTTNLATITQSSPKEVRDNRIQTELHFNQLTLNIDHLNQKLKSGSLNLKDKKAINDLLLKLTTIKNNILEEWSIYLTRSKTQVGEFGYISPYYFYFENDALLHDIDTESNQVKEHCLREIHQDLKKVLEENIRAINLETKAFKPSFISKLKELFYGNQNNQNDSINKILASKEEILKNLTNSTLIGDFTNNLDACYQATVDIIATYNQYLYGSSALSKRLATLNNFYTQQVENIYSVFNRRQAVIEFFSSLMKQETKHNLPEKLYHTMSIRLNSRLVELANNKINSKLYKVLEFFGFSSRNELIKNIDVKLQKLKSRDPLSTEKYVELLRELASTICQLRLKGSTFIDRQRAAALEMLCYNLIEAHCLKQTDHLTLNFTDHQLSDIRGIVYAIQDSDYNKKAEKISVALIRQIKNIQKAPLNETNLLLSAASSYNPMDISINHLTSSSPNEDGKVEIFIKAFIQTMTSRTIANYALGSGLIQGTSTKLGEFGDLVENFALPISGYVAGVAKKGDQKISEHGAEKTLGNMLPLSQWQNFIENQLAPHLGQIFRMQITQMKNSTDIKKFAQFCQNRMFAALKKGQTNTEWADKMTLEEFLIGAIFMRQDKLSIPFRTDHYHQKNDSSMFGKSNFQKMVNSVAFYVKENHLPEPNQNLSTSNIYVGLSSIKPSKKAPKDNPQQIKKSVQKYGMIDLSTPSSEAEPSVKPGNTSGFVANLAMITGRIKPRDEHLEKVFHQSKQTLGELKVQTAAELQYRQRKM